ncbi:hypothetical protein F5Y18DRAFT_426094 [Xylariaceae sp. FL1019]|nr:hypothetical protein F5Y18DRAFT_426094 [Xylariaceae sp. FL1019]
MHPKPEKRGRQYRLNRITKQQGPATTTTPSPARRPGRPAGSGVFRTDSCLCCLNGALDARKTDVCEKTVGRDARYYRCASGHPSCEPVGGEIVQSSGYKEQQYLAWKDIYIYQNPEAEGMKCVITLRFEKGQGYDTCKAPAL